MKYFINYSNERFRNAQKISTKCAKKYGKFDKCIEYNENSIDKDFYESNKKICSQKRGNGYWIWKPYIIKKQLSLLKFGDYLLYSDSGAYIKKRVDYLINSLEKTNQDLMCFQLPYLEKYYSKRDAFILMGVDNNKFSNSKQNLATFVLIKKTKNTVKFVDDWLNYCKDERIITDIPNQMGKNNYTGFIDNRHDQTVFSLLSKKYGYIPFRDPSQFGNKYKNDYVNSDYPQMFYLHHNKYMKTRFGIILYNFLLKIYQNSIEKIIKK